jgi:hypothetical protein
MPAAAMPCELAAASSVDMCGSSSRPAGRSQPPLGFESRVSLSAGWRQKLSGAPLREPRQAMAGMDEPDDAAKGSPMRDGRRVDARRTAAVTDEVEPTTTSGSASDSGVDDKGELTAINALPPIASLRNVERSDAPTVIAAHLTLIWAGRVRSCELATLTLMCDEDRVQQVDGPQELWCRGPCLLPSSLHENMLAGLE